MLWKVGCQRGRVGREGTPLFEGDVGGGSVRRRMVQIVIMHDALVLAAAAVLGASIAHEEDLGAGLA